jgi:hypothetical protein
MNTVAPETYYHTRHSCGHSVYWSDVRISVLCSHYPCPWCGGQYRLNPAPVTAKLLECDEGIYCFRELLPGNRVPYAKGQPIHSPSEAVAIQHMTGNRCCDEPRR